MRVYLAAPVRAPRGDPDAYRAMRSAVAKAGHEIVLGHVAEDDPERAERALGGDRAIFDRDVDALQRADCVVAEVSSPSLGVGWEIAWFLARGRLVVACCRRDARPRLSAMIAGNPSPWQRILVYDAPGDLEAKLLALLA